MSGGATREPDASGPGSVLRAEREALGVTVREVAETLNLSIAIIEAIECDDLDRLPGAVFARGYVRAYARLLELEPDPLLAQYPRATDPAPHPDGATEPAVWEWVRRRPGVVLGAAGGTSMALLVLALTLLWPEDETPPEQAAVSAQAADQRAAFASGPTADSAAEPGFGSEPAATESAGEPPMAGGLESMSGAEPAVSKPEPASPEPANVDAAGEVTIAAAEAQTVRRISDIGDDVLDFSFSDDCWVEIKSGTGANLYSDLSRAGSRLQLLGQGPFRILLGYAPGAQLSFNDEPVPLAPHTRDNVATLVLGQ